jgi:WD40 repeat protein
VASGSGDKTVRLWDAVTGAPLQALEGHSSWVSSVAFSPDGKLVATGSDDETVRLWDAVMGAPLQALEGHSRYVSSVAFSPDGKLVASGSGDKTVRLGRQDSQALGRGHGSAAADTQSWYNDQNPFILYFGPTS